MTPWLVAGVAAVLGIAAVAAAWARRSRGVLTLDEAEACGMAEQALPGFVALGAAIGSDQLAAIVTGKDRRVAVLRVRGPRVIADEVRWDAVRAGPDGLMVQPSPRRSRAILVAEVDALDIRRLSPMRIDHAEA